jgi:hypothetical protein
MTVCGGGHAYRLAKTANKLNNNNSTVDNHHPQQNQERWLSN